MSTFLIVKITGCIYKKPMQCPYLDVKVCVFTDEIKSQVWKIMKVSKTVVSELSLEELQKAGNGYRSITKNLIYKWRKFIAFASLPMSPTL